MSYRACNGEVFAGPDQGTPSTLVGEITGYGVAETAERIDVSVMGSCVKSYLGGSVETVLRLDGFSLRLPSSDADSTQDAGQALFITGEKLSLAIQPAGTGSGKPRTEWSSVTINGQEKITAEVNGSPVWNIDATANVAADETAQT